MSTGCFVVLEGPEGAGKSTLSRALAERMREHGVEPVVVRDPGTTPVAEVLRHELWHAERPWTPEAELLYIATCRADLVTLVIRPALARGDVVLSERFELSTLAYQGAGRGIPPDRIEWINAAATGGLHPDLTLVLDLPPGVGRGRQGLAGKGADRMEREGDAFHERVAAAYLAATGAGVHHIDATASPSAVLERAWKALETGCPERFGSRIA